MKAAVLINEMKVSCLYDVHDNVFCTISMLKINPLDDHDEDDNDDNEILVNKMCDNLFPDPHL